MPSGGRILVDGADITYADPRERDMAMVFQNYALYPSKTVRGNLEFPLRMRGVPPAERARRVGDMAKLLGLTRCSTATRASFRAVSSSAWRSGAR